MAEITAIPADVKTQIADLATQGFALLGLNPNCAPEQMVAAITEYVRERKAQQASLSDEQAFALGALLGCQYVAGLHWHWGSVVWDGDEENGAIGVLNADNSLFTNPIGWVFQTMESEGGVPFMLSYNMIAANQTPVFEPNSATGLY